MYIYIYVHVYMYYIHIIVVASIDTMIYHSYIAMNLPRFFLISPAEAWCSNTKASMILWLCLYEHVFYGMFMDNPLPMTDPCMLMVD